MDRLLLCAAWAFFLVSCVEKGGGGTRSLQLLIPYAESGTVEIREQGNSGALYGTFGLDEYGTIKTKLDSIENLVYRIQDLKKREFLFDTAVTSGDITFELPAIDGTVVFGVDALRAWKVSKGNYGRYNEILQEYESRLTCGLRDELRGVHSIAPYDPRTNEPPESLGAAVWSYIIRMGEEHQMLVASHDAGLPPATRLNTLTYAYASTQDAEDQVDDGKIFGVPIDFGGMYLPGDHNAEPRVQSIRGFLASEKNTTGISPETVMDILRCASATHNLDIDSPHTEIDAGAVAADGEPLVLGGSWPFICKVHDESPIRSVWWEVKRGDDDLTTQILNNEETNIDGTHATSSVRIDSSGVSDSELSISCFAKDRWDNLGHSVLAVAVNRIDAQVSVVFPSDGEVVSGDMRTVCHCEDTSEIISCELLSPIGHAVVCDDIQPLDDGIGYERACSVDTTALEEGTTSIICGGSSIGQDDPTTDTIDVEIDNRPNGLATILSTYEHPVQLGAVSLRAVDRNGLGDILSICDENTASCRTGEDGTAVVDVSDSFWGDVAAIVESPNPTSRASYISEPSSVRVHMPVGIRQIVIVSNYEPGQSFFAVASGLSTASARWFLWALSSGMDYTTAKHLSRELFGTHYSSQPINFWNSVPPDLSIEQVATVDDGFVLAASHYAMAYQLLLQSIEHDPEMTPPPSYIGWELLSIDLDFDGRSNGISADGPLAILDNGVMTLNGQFFRYAHAAGLDYYFENYSTTGGISNRNLSCSGCMYDRIVLDDSILFDAQRPEDPLVPFDRTDPLIECISPSADGTTVVGSTLGRFECICGDNRRVSRFEVVWPPEWSDSTLDQDGTPDRIFGVGWGVDGIDALVGETGDIPLEIELACYDETENEGTATLSLIVDRKDPETTILPFGVADMDGTQLVTESPVTVSVQARDANGVTLVQLDGNPAEHVEDDIYQAEISVPSDGEFKTTIAQAYDTVGNTASDSTRILLVTEPPMARFESPAPEMCYADRMDLVVFVVDPAGIPLSAVVVTEPTGFSNAAVHIDGATASVELYGASTSAFVEAMELGLDLRVCVTVSNIAGLEQPYCVSGFLVDAEPPTGNIINIEEGDDIPTTSTAVAVSVSDVSGVASVTVNGVPAVVDPTDGLWKCMLHNLSEGINAIEVQAVDQRGNAGIIASTTVDVDVTPPSIATELRTSSSIYTGSPLDLSYPISGEAWLFVRASDRNGISDSSVAIANGNTAIGSAVIISPCDHNYCVAFPVDTVILSNGPHTIQTVVRDGLGTPSQVDAPGGTISVVVDNDDPRIGISANTTITNQRDVQITWIAEDDVGPITNIEIEVSGANETQRIQPSPVQPSGSWTVPLPVDDGVYGITVYGTDDAGHTAPSNVVSVSLDTRRPVTNPVVSKHEQGTETDYSAREVGYSWSDTDLWTDAEPLIVYRSDFLQGSGPLPIWNFVVNDADGPVQTNDSDLQVEFRYSIKNPGEASWTPAVDWQHIESENAPLYAIRGTSETLTTAALAAEASAKHRLDVRTTDAAGNTSQVLQKEFAWNFVVKPVIVSGCTPTDDITSASIRNRTMDERHSGADVPVMSAMLYWPLQVIDDSTLIDATADIALSGGQVTTAFFEISAQVEEGDWPVHDGDTCNIRHLDERCYGLVRSIHTGELFDIPSFPRTIGPDDWCVMEGAEPCWVWDIWWRVPGDICECNRPPRNLVTLRDAPSLQWTHPVKYNVPEAGPEFDEGVRVRLHPNRDYPMTIIADSPQVFIDGNLYAWPEFDTDAGASYWYAERSFFDARAQHECEFLDGTVPICVNQPQATEYVSAVRMSISRLLGQVGPSSFGGDVRVVFTDECLQSIVHNATMTGESTQTIADTGDPND